MMAQTRTRAKIVRTMPPPDAAWAVWAVPSGPRFSGVFSPWPATARMKAGEVSISTEGRARIRLKAPIGRGPGLLEDSVVRGEAQVVHHRPGQQDDGQRVEPHERDQHEHRRRADVQRRRVGGVEREDEVDDTD